MQNQSYIDCKIEYVPIDLPDEFPASHPLKTPHSPSADQISFMHYHNNVELGYCYKGCGLFFIDGRIEPFSAGDATIIFQNQIHIAQSNKSEPSQWKFINIDPLKLLADIAINDLNIILDILKQNVHVSNIFSKNDESGINRMIFSIICELENCGKNYKSMVKSLLWSVMVEMSRIDTLFANPAVKINHQHIIKIAPALKFISDNYMNQVSINDLSKKCSISTSHLRRLFADAIGLSPSEYLCMVRIKMASILLINQEESILEVSMEVGYNTLSSFNRHFKSIMGVSPKQWRKQKAPN